MRSSLALSALLALLLAAAPATAITLDFETEDDFTTALVNGQIVDPVFDAADLEFGNLVDISSTDINGGHLGVTVFDSDLAGPNAGGADGDLLVGTGNILILQNSALSGTTLDGTVGLVYDEPDDEQQNADSGSILFEFVSPVTVLSIDIIDANGGFASDVTLTDSFGETQVYSVPAMWTGDIEACVGCAGFDTLDLTGLVGQLGEGGSTTSITPNPSFDPNSVVSLDVSFVGNPSSGGVDNLVFELPEPGLGWLVLGGLGALAARRRR